LKEEGFKLTPQRLAIIDFLEGRKDHPSAEDIFRGIRKKWPMISFSTVYNTLEVLEKMGAVRQLTIAENKVNFDPETKPHPHLLCEVCNQIIDLPYPVHLDIRKIRKHKIRAYRVYFYGICSDCLNRDRPSGRENKR
jgi:Fur family peroxide stress response transcriptional regulator